MLNNPLLQDQPSRQRKPGVLIVSLVVAHCQAPLHWLEQYTLNYKDISRVVVLSKCGHPVVGAPSFAKTVILPKNMGRCDQSYAMWISEMVEEEDALLNQEHIVVFLKDNDNNGHFPHGTRSFRNLISGASDLGFSCQAYMVNWNSFYLSSYALTEELLKMSIQLYSRKERNIHYTSPSQKNTFKAKHNNFGEWLQSVGVYNIPEVAPVCYGGNFAGRASNFKKYNSKIWRKLGESLSRGDSIEEGHFAERSWGLLLADPLERDEVEILQQLQIIPLREYLNSFRGMLVKEGWY